MKNNPHKLTPEEFKLWLMTFDDDKDGRISRDELRKAIRVTRGGRFTAFKGWRGVRSVDANRNGYIDINEIENLVDFADKVLGLKVVRYY